MSDIFGEFTSNYIDYEADSYPLQAIDRLTVDAQGLVSLTAVVLAAGDSDTPNPTLNLTWDEWDLLEELLSIPFRLIGLQLNRDYTNYDQSVAIALYMKMINGCS